MERPPLGPGSRPHLLAAPARTARTLEMHVVDQPAAAARAHHVDRQHLIAIRALQLHAKGPQLIVTRHDQRSFDDPITGVVEIFLDHGDALLQYAGVHVVRRGASLGAPELTHALEIVCFDRGEKLRDRLIHRLRDRRARPGIFPAGGAAGEQEQSKREPSLHEARPVVKVTRR